MTRKHRLTILIAAAFLLLVVTGYVRYVYDYLSPYQPVDAEILVVEGWLPEAALEMAAREFHKGSYNLLITTGFPFSQGVMLGVEGKLVFRPSLLQDNQSDPNGLILTVDGTKAGGESAHFRVYADTLCLGEAWASQKPEDYQFRIPSAYQSDSIVVSFDNDFVGDGEDRNLRVKSLEIGNQTFPANDSSVFFYYKDTGYYGIKKQMAIGSAHDAAGYLARFIGQDSIQALETTWKTRSKTYTTALDVSRWIATLNSGQDAGINIWTMGPHSRRTWVSYRKAFGKSARIGIISYSDESVSRKNWWKSSMGRRMILRETLGLMFIFLMG